MHFVDYIISHNYTISKNIITLTNCQKLP